MFRSLDREPDCISRLLDPRTRWSKVGEFPNDHLGSLIDPPGPLWINGNHTYNGENDYVLVEELDKVDGSLTLICVDGGLQLHVWTDGAFGNLRRRVQAEFSFGGVTYRLSVTDPLIKTWARDQSEGVYSLGLRYLTISLGEPWQDGRCYKLVAAIIRAHDETGYGRI